jgi:RNA polymerase sigma factor (sigma-70 family)
MIRARHVAVDTSDRHLFKRGYLIPLTVAALGRTTRLDNDELLKLLKTIEKLAKTLARRRGLLPEDVEDFAQDTLLKVMSNGHATLRKFRGDSSMTTFMASVVGFYFKDWTNSKWGKYRTPKPVARLGEPAITLHRLMVRDRLSFAEACEKLRTDHGVVLSEAELAAIAARLQLKFRPQLEPPDALITVPAPDTTDRNIVDQEKLELRQRIDEILKQWRARLTEQDALIVSYWIDDGLKFVDVAKLVGIPQKKVYERVDALRKQLRRLLEDAGIDGATIRDLLE